MFSLVGLISGISKLFSVLVGWFQRRNDVKAGEQIQAAHETAVSANTETAIAEAEVAAPKTQAAVVAALESGTF